MQIFLSIRDFFSTLADFAAVLGDLFSARAALNIALQFRSILFQLIGVPLKLLPISGYIFSGFAYVADILANLAPPDIVAIVIPVRIARAVKHIMTKAAIVEVAISPTSIVGD